MIMKVIKKKIKGERERLIWRRQKIKKREYSKNRYRNMSEEERKRLKEYQKIYREVRKSQYNNCDIITK